MTADAEALALLAGLVLEDGRLWGDAAADWQWEDAREVLGGERRLHFLTRPKGGSKTTDLAGIALAALVHAAPPGSRSYAVAVDADQARLLLDSVEGFVRRTEGLEQLVTVQARRVIEPPWDPRRLLTLETRMEHGSVWSVPERSSVSG